jgi:hypothetical protein
MKRHQIYSTHPWYIRLLWFKLLFSNHDVTHLIREQLLSGSPASVEEANIPTSPESAAQALDGSSLVEVDNICLQ